MSKLPELVKCGKKGCGHKADFWSQPCPEDGCIRYRRAMDEACFWCHNDSMLEFMQTPEAKELMRKIFKKLGMIEKDKKDSDK